LHRVLRGAAPPGETGVSGYGLHHLAFEMRTPQELLEKYREFRREGLEIVNARRGGPGSQPRFYARGPDGNLLEFYWGMTPSAARAAPAHTARSRRSAWSSSTSRRSRESRTPP
jgi:catechol-2,3-dioxygenase